MTGVGWLTFVPGGIAEYRFHVTKSGTYPVIVRYRSAAGARLEISSGGKPLAEWQLSPSAQWTETTVSIPLEDGLGLFRLEATQGNLDLDWMEFR